MSFSRPEQVSSRFFAHTLQGDQFLRQAMVPDVFTRPASYNCLERDSPSPEISMAAWRQMNNPLITWAGQAGLNIRVAHREAGQLLPQDRQFFGITKGLTVSSLPLDDAHNLGDDISCFMHDHSVTDHDIFPWTISSLCRLALFTTDPPGTGLKIATGVMIPVRPTFTEYLLPATFSSAENLKATAHLGPCWLPPAFHENE